MKTKNYDLDANIKPITAYTDDFIRFISVDQDWEV